MGKNIGIILPSSKNGGVFQLALSLAAGLIDNSDEHKYYLISHNFAANSINVPDKKMSAARKILQFFGMAFGFDFLLIKDFYFIFKKHNIDLLVFPTPSSFDFFPYRIPFVTFIPDLMHKYYHNFPEYGIINRLTRDITYGYFAKHAILNLVDSDCGAADLKKFFKIPADKIKVVPYIPPSYIYEFKDMRKSEADEALKKYDLPDEFVFYPAQFWAHKNHLRLIKAIKTIKENTGTQVNLVLSGYTWANDKNYKKVVALAEQLKIRKQIIHLGYVTEKEMAALYRKSLALVFASLGGPTNIPIVEAIIMGVPVACSNLFSMPEQIGNAGILFDPFNEDDMANKIYKIWTDENLREKCVENAKKISLKNTKEHFAINLQDAVKEALSKI